MQYLDVQYLHCTYVPVSIELTTVPWFYLSVTGAAFPSSITQCVMQTVRCTASASMHGPVICSALLYSTLALVILT